MSPRSITSPVISSGSRTSTICRSSAIAVTDCDVVELDAATAGGAISRSPALSAAIEQIANSRRRRVEPVARRIGLEIASTEASDQVDAPNAPAGDGETLGSPDVTGDGSES